MAGDWIKVEKATARKPEILRLSELLSIHPDHAFALCIRFWFWCDDQLATCHAKNVTLVTLDHVICHAGFAKALVEVGWLQAREGSLVVPNFERHLSQGAKKRALDGKRKEKQRHENVTKMSRSKADNSVTREEKRRDNNKEIDIAPADDFAGQALDPSKWNLPDSWRTGELLAAMSGWQSHLSQTHGKKFLEIHAVQLCQKHHAWGPEKLARALRESIVAGAKNVFDPDDQRKPSGGYSGNRSQVVKGLT